MLVSYFSLPLAAKKSFNICFRLYPGQVFLSHYFLVDQARHTMVMLGAPSHPLMRLPFSCTHARFIMCTRACGSLQVAAPSAQHMDLNRSPLSATAKYLDVLLAWAAPMHGPQVASARQDGLGCTARPHPLFPLHPLRDLVRQRPSLLLL